MKLSENISYHSEPAVFWREKNFMTGKLTETEDISDSLLFRLSGLNMAILSFAKISKIVNQKLTSAICGCFLTGKKRQNLIGN